MHEGERYKGTGGGSLGELGGVPRGRAGTARQEGLTCIQVTCTGAQRRLGEC